MAKVNSIDVKQKFVELRAEGRPYSEISKELNVSKPTLTEWAKNMETEIANLKAVHLE